MSNAPTNRSRWRLPEPKAPIRVVLEFFRRSDVWSRIALCVLTTTILWIVAYGWSPPFSYRSRQAPLRDMTSRTTFEVVDPDATADAKSDARAKINCFYQNDIRPLQELRGALIDDIFEVKQAEFTDVANKVWRKFLPYDETTPDKEDRVEATEEEFVEFRESIAADEQLQVLRGAIDKAFIQIDAKGLLESLEHEFGDGSMQEIKVYPLGNIELGRVVQVPEVRVAQVTGDLKKNLLQEIRNEVEVFPNPKVVADHVFNWFQDQLPNTLTYDEASSKRAADKAAEEIEPRMKKYEPGSPLEKLAFQSDGDSAVIRAGKPLESEDLALLYTEHTALVMNSTFWDKLIRSIMFFGLFGAMFSMMCGYLYHRDLHLLSDLKEFAKLLGLMLFTLMLMWVTSIDADWRAELVPLVIFAMTIAIVYHIELSFMLSALVALTFTVMHGFGLGEFVILVTAASSSAVMCRSIRSRTKLVYVGIVTALAVFPTTLGAQYLMGQPFTLDLLIDAAWFAGSAMLGVLLTSMLLPFIEKLFDIQTDISLLELSDANHPLLKELVQRAPGTYNHSINVASISEAAAEAIGANGLLCRVGAYFHDIGKLRKPEYFIENQGGGENKHDDLVPAMSTLVIVAHVKDGVEMGRTHRLPRRIIDLIEQHHGTTLVEYFFNRATRVSEEDPDSQAVEEADFRYPGPKPQTKEAAVMMLADTVESASRALREPTPSRIENLVATISKKKLDDGQFDECSITLQELHTIQESLIKSLNAMYHARVKYPDQQSA